MYKLLATDVDGTLIGRDFIISQANKSAIAAAQAAGIHIVLCSGRSYESLKFFAKDLGIIAPGNYLIGFNGCTIYDLHTSAVLFEHGLAAKPAALALEACVASGIKAEPVVYINSQEVMILGDGIWSREYMQTSKVRSICVDNQAAAIRDRGSDIGKIIFIGANEDLQTLNTALKKTLGDSAAVFFSSDYLLEVMTTSTNKGAALTQLCRHLNINTGETIAIGDNHNDISMLQAAGAGIAVNNAVPELKAIADYITLADCDNDAVAETINKFILI